MSIGIDKLVDTFMGNPQPLEAKVERDNKGKPPNAIPKDLEEAIALQEIADLHTGAQNQQAMQAGGAQPSVVQKLQQILASAQQRQQAQMQPPQGMPRQMPRPMPQQPVMAARGGSLDQLMSNLARHYDGGGIVAFNGTDDSDVKDESLVDRYAAAPKLAAELGVPVWAYRQAQEFLARTGTNATVGEVALALAKQGGKGLATLGKGAVDVAKLAGTGPGMAVLAGGVPATQFTADVMKNNPKLREAYTDNYMLGAMDPDNALGAAILNESAGKQAAAQKRQEAVDADPETEKLKRLAAVKLQTGQNTNPALQPRPSRENAPRPNGPAGPSNKPGIDTVKPDTMDPMEAAIRANIMKELAKDEDAEWQKGAKRHEDFMGINQLLAPREARIAEREGMQRKIQSERLPDWVAGLDRASKPILTGGIGTLLNQYGTGKQEQKKAYDTEDLKFFDDISAMKDEVAKLKLEGKYKAAAAGEASIKDAIANKRQAEQSGTSLLTNKENAEMRKQIAREGMLNRAAQATAAKDAKNMANAINAVKNDEVINRLQKRAEELGKMPVPSNKAAADDIMRQIEARQNAIYKQFGVLEGLSTMAEAPGVKSPGGTKPGWGKASTV